MVGVGRGYLLGLGFVEWDLGFEWSGFCFFFGFMGITIFLFVEFYFLI